jgi:PIN domain nuclease of toxin-antitoxin system
LAGQLAARGGANWLVDLESLHALLELPTHYRDPFDRMLIAQAKVHAFTLISPDPWIKSD